MHYAEYKTILSPNKNINIYRGCSHGCIYCDSRSKCYQMTHDFEDIEVKKDAPAMLEDQYGILDYCIRAKVHAILCFGFSMTLREGNREYYNQMLDHWFPGLKAHYNSHFGNSYVCASPNSKGLMDIFKNQCEKHQNLQDSDKVFAYLKQYETKHAQMSLF